MAGYNVINPRCAFTSIAHFYTFMKKGPRVRNIKIIWFLPLRVINKADILFLQNNYYGFLIYCNKFGELYAIN